MSTILFEGDPKQGGIPRKSTVRVESLPNKDVIFHGVVSKAVALDLDPGKYVYSVVKILNAKRHITLNYNGEFLHDIEEDAWSKLKDMRPQMCKCIQTSEGPRWRCTFPRCAEEEFSSEVSALLHEVSHFGVSEKEFLKNPDMAVFYNGQSAVEQYVEDVKNRQRAEGIAPPDPLRLGSPVATTRE